MEPETSPPCDGQDRARCLFFGAADNFRRAAIYADRTLKRAKPSELPVQAPVKFEMLINMKTARSFGLPIPMVLLSFADEVIE